MITINKPGLLTTIQDLGRFGFQKYGVITSGAMDQFSHRIANLLVGNPENLATLEITLLGPTLFFEEDALISLCGAELSPSINGEPIPMWRPIFIKKGSTLIFGSCKNGFRTYLAVAGGFAVPSVMNSKSTYLRAGIGGFQGRPLRSGDQLLWQTPGRLSSKISQFLEEKLINKPFQAINWFSFSSLLASFEIGRSIRILEGMEFPLFTKESQEHLFTDSFRVGSNSDRMGYRLQGPKLLLLQSSEMISEAVTFGTIQVPPDGNPIILLADRQTTGGYPRIGQIATIDLPLIAQAKPGDILRFKKISHAEAQILYLKRELAIRLFKQGILQKFR